EPPEDDPPPAPPSDEPTEKTGPEGGTKILPWLCVGLGAALLILGVCLLQLMRMNHRLDDLQQAVEAVRSMDSLREKIEQLQKQLDQAELDSSHLLPELENLLQKQNTLAIRKWQSDYLFYIRQFIDNGDYSMAALVAGLSAERYFNPANIASIPTNPAQAEQYQEYRQELIDRGYLEKAIDPAHIPLDSHFPPTRMGFAAQWDPEQNPDMAALGILWCAMDKYYVTGVPEAAAQYLLNYQWYSLYAGESEGARYPQRILDTASDYTIQQYEWLIQDLITSGWVVETDGELCYGTGQNYTDVRYSLSFDPPGGYLYGEAHD
ncbi:MAG: hypothetical protein K2M42_12630, partial [Oscillospiraceae bacterium]|nr:hypothetical protein [Oscillospiraceae bacterium]